MPKQVKYATVSDRARKANLAYNTMMAIEETKTAVVAAGKTEEDTSLGGTLRPQLLDDFIGQSALKKSLRVFLQATRDRGEPLEHLLLAGPPGLGKTSLGQIVAREMNTSIRITAGPALTKIADLAGVLTSLQPGDVLFIDEIHRLQRSVEEVLYPAMEDFALDLVVGQGPGAKTLRLDLPRFTLVGATTRIGMLGSPLRDRFGMTYRLSFYSEEEMQQIIHRSAGLLHVAIDDESVAEISRRCRRTPRIANRLLKRVRDYAQVKGYARINHQAVGEALDLLEVDQAGLDVADRRVLQAMIKHFDGGPVGLQTLASVTAEEERTIVEVIEPFLLQCEFIQRTPRGRSITDSGRIHINEATDQATLL